MCWFFMGKMTSEVATRAEIFHGHQTTTKSGFYIYFHSFVIFSPISDLFSPPKKCEISTRFDAFSTQKLKKNHASGKTRPRPRRTRFAQKCVLTLKKSLNIVSKSIDKAKKVDQLLRYTCLWSVGIYMWWIAAWRTWQNVLVHQP